VIFNIPETAKYSERQPMGTKKGGDEVIIWKIFPWIIFHLLSPMCSSAKIPGHRRQILTNTSEIAGKEIVETLGIVKGSTIRAKHIGKDIASAFRQLVGGELKEYSEMLNEARQIATGKMVEEAEKLGADAVINIRFFTSAVMQGAAEILVYGTAVKLRDKK